ncbi:hypothetical protein GHK63_29210 [Sinorhizobium meliloti]|nr:hypothetical protein [Sinorhizobium meliloti]
MVIKLEAIGIGINEILHAKALPSILSLFVLHIPSACRKTRNSRKQKYAGYSQRRRFHNPALLNPKTHDESMEHFL